MSVLSPSTACTIASPPLPPSPPFGPPNSMNFSRRNDTQPLPPSPERIETLASSRNRIAAHCQRRANERKRSLSALALHRQRLHAWQFENPFGLGNHRVTKDEFDFA